ncbi:MAG: O-antigen ligase family protein, partial [Bdellovibrionaceae bacterium]|nr:O-antigen ligase family protein [Pseudobdellovibrionaceae bacterium]
MSENTKKRLNMAFKIYLLVAPLLFCLSNSGAPFELIKLLALVTFALLAASIVAINTVQSGEIQIRWNPALTISAGLLLVNFISYVFSIDRYLSFWGDDQIPADSLLSVFAIFALCFSVVQIQPTRKDILAFLKVIVLTTSLMAAHGLLQYFGIARFQELHIFGSTMVSTIGQAVIYCNVLVCAVPLFIFLYTSEKNTAVKTLLAVGFLLTEAALFLSESRTPWLINLTMLLLYVLNLLRRLRHSHHKKLIGGAVFLFAILAIRQLQAPLNTRLSDKLSSAALQKGLEARVLVWKDGLASLQDHLLIGSGPETFGIEQKKYQSIELNMNEYWKSYWAKAHNAVIQLTVTTGLLGLLAYLSIYIYLAFRLFKCSRTQSVNTDLLCAIAFPVFLIFLCNLTSFNYLVTQTYTSFLFVLFVLIDTPKTEIIKTRATPVYRFALWTLVVVQLGLVASTFTYWYSDILLQESYRQMKAQNEPDAALELAGRALAFNSSNPFVY